MCVHIGAEVVLANLLSGKKKEQGVSFEDINMYCQKVREQMGNVKADDFVYFAVDKREVKDTVLKYPQMFNMFKNRIFGSDVLKKNQFNSRYTDEIRGILQQTI